MDQDPSASVGGTMMGGEGQRVPAFASGRVCREPGCETQLSVYNSGAYCARHECGCVHRPHRRRRATEKALAALEVSGRR
jgi:recombinational DNA repair protein (RecF pathway)